MRSTPTYRIGHPQLLEAVVQLAEVLGVVEHGVAEGALLGVLRGLPVGAEGPVGLLGAEVLRAALVQVPEANQMEQMNRFSQRKRDSPPPDLNLSGGCSLSFLSALVT